MGKTTTVQKDPIYFVYAAIAFVATIPFTYWALKSDLTVLEENLFILINSLPDWLNSFLFVIMQLGAVISVLLVSGIFAVWGKFSVARAILLSGVSAWLVTKIAKYLVTRERPDGIVDLLIVRDVASGLGYPSGHTAVAFAMAIAIAPYVKAWQRKVLYALAILVGVSRVYVGVHLPFDIIGGALIGSGVAFLAHGILGVKKFSYSKEQVKRILSSLEIKAKTIKELDVDARGSIVYLAKTPKEQLLVKVYGPAHQTADWLFKLHRKFLYKHTESETPFLTGKQRVEHEIFSVLFAKDRGIRVPTVYEVATSEDGVVYSVQQFIKGKSLDKLSAKDINRQTLDQIWDALKKLRRSRIAHRDLRTANILKSQDNHVYLIDFDYAEIAADDHHLDKDLAELMVSLCTRVPVEQVVDSAIKSLGKSTVKKVLPLLEPKLFSSANKQYLKNNKGLLEAIIAQVENRTRETMPQPQRFRKKSINLVLSLVILALAFYFLSPRINEIGRAWDNLATINPAFIPLLILLSFGTYVAAAVTLRGAIPDDKPLKDLIELQLAGSFINRITPSSLGSIGLNTLYLYKQNYSKAQSALIALLPLISGLATSALIILFVLLFINFRLNSLQLPLEAGAIAIGVLAVLAAAALLLPKSRQYLKGQTDRIAGSLRTIKEPSHLLQLFLGAAMTTLFFGWALYISAVAVGIEIQFAEVLFAMLAGTAVGSLSPTPGGLGVEEAGLIAALGFFGAHLGAAVAAVLIYRLATFWLPIPFGALAFQRLRKRNLI